MKKKPSIASDKTAVTLGQKESCVTLVTDAARKATGVAIDELIQNGVLNRENIERIRARGHEVVAEITRIVKRKFAELADENAGCVKLVSDTEMIGLDPTDGKATLASARDLFVHIDGDFNNWQTNVPGPATGKASALVYEIIKDGTFNEIFCGLSDYLDFSQLFCTQEQIIQFVKKHRKWLRAGGYGATYFLFRVGNYWFVANVFEDLESNLGVGVTNFWDSDVLNADDRHRIVVFSS